MAFWTYILRNPKGRFYIGHADNLGIRVSSHNSTDKISGKFTRKNEIKSWKSAKLVCERLLDTEK